MSHSLRLFLIEDDDDIALLIRRSLERCNHHVTRCRSAADALIVLANEAFDLILLDQLLPDMSGLAFLERLESEGISVPVLMVTAHGDESLAASVLRAGALDYIVKDQALTFLADLPKRIEESFHRHSLEQTNALLIEALESARDGVLITDLQGTILKVNQALVEMTGYPREELLGNKPELFWARDSSPEFFSKVWNKLLNRNSWQGELTIERKDDVVWEASITLSPILDLQSRLTHFVGILRDITEFKQLQRQLLQAQKMQSVGTLAGGVAHEFNNLMAGINGYASLALREDKIPPTAREYLQHVTALSQRAALLTRQLLAFARKPALIRQATPIPDLVKATVELVRRTLHREVVLELPESSEVLLLVDADSNQLQQALVNLAVNARDALHERDILADSSGALEETPLDNPANSLLAEYTKPIHFRVEHFVTLEEQIGFPQNVAPGDYIRLSVTDEGIGMDREVLNQAVDPFFTTKDVGKGTGLGLPMVYGIVQGHHGCMTIESSPGNGSCVSLYLPRLLEASTVKNYLPFEETELSEPEGDTKYDILVIDDEDAVRDVLLRFLQIAGHRLRSASSTKEAIEELANDEPVDLIVLDLMIPREDPQSNLHLLKELWPNVPVLLCTGIAEYEKVKSMFGTGVAGVLRKPFRMNELWYAVHEALANEQTQDSGAEDS